MSEAQQLKFAKFLLIGILAIFALSSGGMRHWPFLHWSLYDRGEPKIPEAIARIELRVLDTDGNWHALRSMDLYTLDDDSSSQPAGRLLIQKAFLESPEQWEIYRPYLIKQIQKQLKINVKLIEAYRYIWQLNFNTFPPLDIKSPTKQQKIDSYKAKDYLSEPSQ